MVTNDEAFLSNWYSKLQKNSLEFTKDFVTFCKETMTDLTNEIRNTENELQQLPGKDTFKNSKTQSALTKTYVIVAVGKNRAYSQFLESTNFSDIFLHQRLKSKISRTRHLSDKK